MPGVTPAVLAETLRVQPLVAELRNGVLKVEGLSELRRTRLGEGLLRAVISAVARGRWFGRSGLVPRFRKSSRICWVSILMNCLPIYSAD